jgi:hypothetical protein
MSISATRESALESGPEVSKLAYPILETKPAEANLPKLAFSIPEAGRIIGVSDVTVRRLLKRGKLRCLNSLRHKIIPMAEIERFLKSDLRN